MAFLIDLLAIRIIYTNRLTHFYHVLHLCARELWSRFVRGCQRKTNLPLNPKLAMAIKITIVALICIVMLVIVQARNELYDVLTPLKTVSEIEQPESNGNGLVKRNWAAACLAGGSTLFAGIAAGSYQLAKAACSPAILARLSVSTMSVGVEYFFFWAGLTLLSTSVLLLLSILVFDSLIN